jgi:ribosome-binding factor A
MVQAIKAAQLADQLRDYLAQWTAKDLAGYFFTITYVTLSPDLQRATAWVDVLRPDDTRVVLRRLEKEAPGYQRQLSRTLRRQNIPTIHFALDNRESAAQRIDELLNQ